MTLNASFETEASQLAALYLFSVCVLSLYFHVGAHFWKELAENSAKQRQIVRSREQLVKPAGRWRLWFCMRKSVKYAWGCRLSFRTRVWLLPWLQGTRYDVREAFDGGCSHWLRQKSVHFQTRCLRKAFWMFL